MNMIKVSQIQKIVQDRITKRSDDKDMYCDSYHYALFALKVFSDDKKDYVSQYDFEDWFYQNQNRILNTVFRDCSDTEMYCGNCEEKRDIKILFDVSKTKEILRCCLDCIFLKKSSVYSCFIDKIVATVDEVMKLAGFSYLTPQMLKHAYRYAVEIMNKGKYRSSNVEEDLIVDEEYEYEMGQSFCDNENCFYKSWMLPPQTTVLVFDVSGSKEILRICDECRISCTHPVFEEFIEIIASIFWKLKQYRKTRFLP